MTTVRRVQYGVPGSGSGDPAAGAPKARVVVTQESEDDAKRFEKLLDGGASRSPDAATAAKRQAAERTRQLDRMDRKAGEEPLDDETPTEHRPTDTADDGSPAEVRRQMAEAEEAGGASPESAEAMVESDRSDESQGVDEASSSGGQDDEPAETPSSSATTSDSGTESRGVVPVPGASGGERHMAAPPVATASHTGEHQHREHGSSGFDDDAAAAVAAAAALPPMSAGLAGAAIEPAVVDKAADSAAQAVSEIARQVAAQLSVRQATPGAASQVRIRLQDDVLPKTSLMITTEGDTVQVTVTTGSADSAALVEANAAALATAIAGRTGRAARIRYRDQSGGAREAEADPAFAPDEPAAPS